MKIRFRDIASGTITASVLGLNAYLIYDHVNAPLDNLANPSEPEQGVTTIMANPDPGATINPLSLSARPMHNNVVQESREPVPLSDSQYWAVGRLVYLHKRDEPLTDGNIAERCSATYVYGKDIEENSILTAGHCFVNEDRKKYNWSNVRFVANFVDDETGELRQFASPVNQASIRAEYEQDGTNSYMNYRDLAIATLRFKVPEEIKPLPVVIDVARVGPIISAGYPADKEGLQIDKRDDGFTAGNAYITTSWSDLSGGSSGGPVLQERSGRAHVVGVNSSLLNSNKASIHTVVSAEALNSLTTAGIRTVKDLLFSCVQVHEGVNTLNVRRKPSTNSDIVGGLKGGTSRITFERKGKWGKIGMEDGSDGWIHLDYTHKAPCFKP